MKRPTQQDVAKLAGVSRVTVSMVLNGKADGNITISDETRVRVFDAAQKLGYAPNPVAQMLKEGSNHLLGVFVYDSHFPYDTDSYLFNHLIGVEREAALQDYNILFFTRNRQHNAPKIYVNGMNAIRLADGVIIMGSEPDRDEIKRLADENYPFVCIGRREIPGSVIDWASDDYESAGQQIAEHLVSLGHRHIGYISGLKPREAHEEKLAGCQQVIDQCSGAELRLLPGDSLESSDVFLSSLDGLTALICSDYGVFEPALDYLFAEGVDIPGDLSICSLTPVTHTFPYKLLPTYIQLDRQEVGRAATRLLVERLQGQRLVGKHVRVGCDLVVGETTGPPKKYIESRERR